MSPLYPGLTLLQHPGGSPFAEFQESPYLQTASAEFPIDPDPFAADLVVGSPVAFLELLRRL